MCRIFLGILKFGWNRILLSRQYICRILGKFMHDPKVEESVATSKKRWQEFLGGNPMPKRLVLVLLFLIILTCFLQLREVRMEVLEVGEAAPRYVIAQTDFSFLDEEATQTLKKESVRDIGAIYRAEEEQVAHFRRSFEENLIENQRWRKELPDSTFEEVYAILDKIEAEMAGARFTDGRTLKKMKFLQMPVASFYLVQAQISESGRIPLPHSLWNKIQNDFAADKQFHPDAVEYLVASFAVRTWPLQEDFSIERTIRNQVQSKISNRFTHVFAGSQIIKKGEIASSRHIAMLQAMKSELDHARKFWRPMALLGSALIALSLTVAALLYLYCFHRELIRSVQKMALLVLILIASMLLAKGAEVMLTSESKAVLEIGRLPLIVPFAALLICVLIGSEIAIISSLFLVIIFGVTLAIDYVPFLVTNFYTAVITILIARRLHRRKDVFAVCGKVWLSLIPLIIGLNLFHNNLTGPAFGADLLSSFAFLALTAVIVVGLLPILESLFEVMTDMTLMEYMDPDHELMRRLSLEAPGTYQHCLVVGNLADNAARAIGANGLFCRVSTLYHDIGKLFNPHYFTENQLGGFNIHQLLTPTESTNVIIAHVQEGEALARKYHLPQSFIDIIREHHGTTMVYYFYCKQVEQMCGDATKVNEKAFSYPGPKPRTKESAIIMIADTVEAASRSIDEATEQAIADMVDKLVAEKAQDGQFDECQLTFEELGRVKKSIVKGLMVARHFRVKYPEKLHPNINGRILTNPSLK